MDIHPRLSWQIIGCALRVHSQLGPGLLESAYEACLCHELAKEGLRFRRQVPVPLRYDSIEIDCGFRMDLVIDDKVVVELKAVDDILPIHIAQLMTYLKASKLSLGLLVNFNVRHLKDGIRRRVMTVAPSEREPSRLLSSVPPSQPMAR